MKPASHKPEPRSTAPLLDARDVASRLGISIKTVRRVIAAGDLPSHRIGRLIRIIEGDLHMYVASSRR